MITLTAELLSGRPGRSGGVASGRDDGTVVCRQDWRWLVVGGQGEAR
jgi:hypothetical protein